MLVPKIWEVKRAATFSEAIDMKIWRKKIGSEHFVKIGRLKLIRNPSNYFLCVRIRLDITRSTTTLFEMLFSFGFCSIRSNNGLTTIFSPLILHPFQADCISFQIAFAMTVVPQNKKESICKHKFEFNFNSSLVFGFFVSFSFWCFLFVFCRCTIRENLRTNYQLPSGINTLKVPNNLQRYIDLMDWIRKAMWCMNALDGWWRSIETKTKHNAKERSRAEQNI